jgi:hypothetical protein
VATGSASTRDHAAATQPILTLGAWAAFGAALIGGHALWQRRSARTSEPDGVAEPAVQDPALEAPVPTALPTHAHHFGELVPTLAGTVYAADGERVPGAAVTVMNRHGHQLVHTLTDHEGRYALTGLPEQTVDVVISAPDMIPTVRQIWVRDGATTRENVVLAPRVAHDALAL